MMLPDRGGARAREAFRSAGAVAICAWALSLAACGVFGDANQQGAEPANHGAGAHAGAGGDDAATGDDASGGAGGDGGGSAGAGGDAGGALDSGAGGASTGPNCAASSTDLAGCPCMPPTTRACYPTNVNPSTRNVAGCKDGTQSCSGSTEVSVFGACTGAVVPAPESCANGADDDCNGLTDCGDPACAQDPACNVGCNDGDTRPCYDGPPGTANVGTCKTGTQTCSGGAWPSTCSGEVLPIAPSCTDLLDQDCNGFKGCDDFWLCVASPSCWGECTAPDPGCVCPVGTGDDATCPDGYFGKAGALNWGTGRPTEVQCCPCTANDCSNRGCCGETVCQGSSWCGGMTCGALGPSCGGKVQFDCDFEDYDPSDSSKIPEDCDMACCKCRVNCL